MPTKAKAPQGPKSQPLTAVKIGNHLSPEYADLTKPTGRHPGALAAVLRWHAEHPALFWCSNPFELEAGSPYRGGFAHLYYDPDGILNTVYVSYKGTKVTHVPTDRTKRPLDAGETKLLAEIGLFEGGSKESPLWLEVQDEPAEPLDADSL